MKYVESGKKVKSGVKHVSFDFTVQASAFSYNAVRMPHVLLIACYDLGPLIPTVCIFWTVQLVNPESFLGFVAAVNLIS